MLIKCFSLQQQQPTQQFIVQSPGPNKTILNQNVVFINQTGQQQIITSNQQQQGNNVGECKLKKIILKNIFFSRWQFFQLTFDVNFFLALNQQQQRIMTSQQSMVSYILFFFYIEFCKETLSELFKKKCPFSSQQIQGQQILIHSSVQQPNQNQLLQSPQVSFVAALNFRIIRNLHGKSK